MSVEQKIKDLLARTGQKQLDEAINGDATPPMQGGSQKASYAAIGTPNSQNVATVGKDSSIAAQNPGDGQTRPKQGNSQDAGYDEREEDDENQGAQTAKGIKPNNLGANGAGQAPNYQTVGDPTSVVNIQNGRGNVPQEGYDEDGEQIEEVVVDVDHRGDFTQRPYRGGYGGKRLTKDGKLTQAERKFQALLKDRMKNTTISGPKGKLPEDVDLDEEQIEEMIDVSSELKAIFGDELSEDFKEKASSIFEAAVVARVNSEIDRITATIQEQQEAEFAELQEALVDKIDSFLNYVVEQWMEENQLQVESGLRTEIAEDFIAGLKTLFQEHYIDVPEDKYDVVEELQAKADALEEQLNSVLEENIAMSAEVAELKKAEIIFEMATGLADTEVEKLAKLVEGVSYDSDELFREKVSVIKETYFPKAPRSSPEEQLLTEEAPMDSSDPMSKYVSALSKQAKSR